MLTHNSVDQNSKLRKFNMADGRHIENGFSVISQSLLNELFIIRD